MTTEQIVGALERLSSVGFTDDQAWALAGDGYDVVAFAPVVDGAGSPS